MNDTDPPNATRQIVKTKNAGHQFVPTIYPSDTPTTTYTPSTLPRQLPPSHPPFAPRFIDRSIVFGVEADSSQSSPIFSPSASSTTFTQSTPVSDTTNSLPHSTYQGYGHVYHLQGHPLSKPLLPSLVNGQALPAFPAPETYIQANTVPLPLEEVQTSSTSQVTKYHPNEGGSLPDRALHSYLLDQFNNPVYSDCRLEIHIGDECRCLMLHRLLIARNTVLQDLLGTEPGVYENDQRIIRLAPSNLFVTFSAITAVVLSYYGESLSNILPFLPETLPTSSRYPDFQHFIQNAPPVDRMRSVLAYLAAGEELNMPDVTASAIRMVIPNISFTTLEVALSYGLYPAQERISEERPIPGNLDESRASHVLDSCIDFMVANFPAPFSLDFQAPSSVILGGFPETPHQENKRTVSNPRLSSIHFGDFPLDTYAPPSPEATTISIVLLSAPFYVLHRIITRLDTSIRGQMLPAIIRERERRRLAFLHNSSIPNLEEADRSFIMEKATWEENVTGAGVDVGVSRSRTASYGRLDGHTHE